MSVREVLIYGQPPLRQRAREVAAVDDRVRALIADLRDTMHAYQGVGLAANQIGSLDRVLVVDVPLGDDQRAAYALVNPVILSRAESETSEEGCLSIPGIYEEVTRSRHIAVTARDENGQPLNLEAEGYLARAIQHEVDHLDGVLFVDRMRSLESLTFLDEYSRYWAKD